MDSSSDSVAETINRFEIRNRQVSFLCGNTFQYAATKFGVWKSGNVSVPLCKSHPVSALEYYVRDSNSDFLIASSEFADKATKLAKKCKIELQIYEDIETQPLRNPVAETENAMIIYTSGTTGSPKGVVSTHKNVSTWISAMKETWHWNSDDRILHVLPLHHVHGIVNCLLTPLTVGAQVHMMSEFDPARTWKRLISGDVNVFMAVPTIYAKLLKSFPFDDEDDKERVRKRLSDFRLMVSGSAALPQVCFEYVC